MGRTRGVAAVAILILLLTGCTTQSAVVASERVQPAQADTPTPGIEPVEAPVATPPPPSEPIAEPTSAPTPTPVPSLPESNGPDDSTAELRETWRSMAGEPHDNVSEAVSQIVTWPPSHLVPTRDLRRIEVDILPSVSITIEVQYTIDSSLGDAYSALRSALATTEDVLETIEPDGSYASITTRVQEYADATHHVELTQRSGGNDTKVVAIFTINAPSEQVLAPFRETWELWYVDTWPTPLGPTWKSSKAQFAGTDRKGILTGFQTVYEMSETLSIGEINSAFTIGMAELGTDYEVDDQVISLQIRSPDRNSDTQNCAFMALRNMQLVRNFDEQRLMPLCGF